LPAAIDAADAIPSTPACRLVSPAGTAGAMIFCGACPRSGAAR
jgi:hypothetical protein